MAPRLRRSESGVAGVQCMLRRETKRAVRAMGCGHAPRGEAIHDARKRLKKARAALRLARAALSKDEYRWENDTLRDAARPLSEVRDAQALIDTLDDLARRGTSAQRRTFRTMRARLTAAGRTLRRRQFREENILPAIRQAVRHVRNRASQLVGDDDGGAVAQRCAWRDAIVPFLLLRPLAPSVSRRSERAEFG